MSIPSNVTKPESLSQEENEYLVRTLSFREDEKLQYHYFLTGPMRFGADPHDCICCSNFRIFKLEGGKYWSVTRTDIKSIAHEENGLLYWDKLVATLKDGETETFGMYEHKVCKFFCELLAEDAKRNVLRWAQEEKEEKERKELEEKEGKDDKDLLKKIAKEAKERRDAALLASCRAMQLQHKLIWNSFQSGARNIAFWQPVASDRGWGTLGSVVVAHHEDLKDRGYKSVMVTGDLFPRPRGFVLAWSNKGRGLSFNKDVSVWIPIPPSSQFRAVGYVAVRGFDPPTEELSGDVRCVHVSLLESDRKAYADIWNPVGTGWKQQIHIFRSPHNTFSIASTKELPENAAPIFPHLKDVQIFPPREPA